MYRHVSSDGCRLGSKGVIQITGRLQVRLPRLEHTCSSLFPRCIGNQCLLRIDVVYPKGARLAHRSR